MWIDAWSILAVPRTTTSHSAMLPLAQEAICSTYIILFLSFFRTFKFRISFVLNHWILCVPPRCIICPMRHVDKSLQLLLLLLMVLGAGLWMVVVVDSTGMMNIGRGVTFWQTVQRLGERDLLEYNGRINRNMMV